MAKESLGKSWQSILGFVKFTDSFSSNSLVPDGSGSMLSFKSMSILNPHRCIEICSSQLKPNQSSLVGQNVIQLQMDVSFLAAGTAQTAHDA